MNSRTFTRVAKFISLPIFYLLPLSGGADWTVDFSRRQSQMDSGKVIDSSGEAELAKVSEEKNIFDRVFESSIPVQDIVILNTEAGFIPATVQVREGAQYRLVIVNVNEKTKNVSFVLDSFSEHHATFYGKIKSFYIAPKKEGVYTFLSPETSAQGRLVVHAAPRSNKAELRLPASE